MFNQHESTVFDNLVALIMDARKLQVREQRVVSCVLLFESLSGLFLCPHAHASC